MSLSKLVFPFLDWSELLLVLSYLTERELYETIGQVNRSGWLTFQREVIVRKSVYCKLNNTILLPKYDNHDKVLLISYPRSGNTYLRQLLESETNITTGSDSRCNRTLTKALIECGFKGEGITTNSVWIVKSHYPERMGYIKFPINQIILLIRNPFDAITSYFHMGMTNTHDKMISNDSFESLRHIYSDLILNESKIWKDFIDFWLLISKFKKIPLFIVRYEDVLLDKNISINNLRKFLLQGQSPKVYDNQKLFNERIITRGYRPKNIKIGKSIDKMTDKDICNVIFHTNHYLSQLGYHIEKKLSKDNVESYSLSIRELTNLNIEISTNISDRIIHNVNSYYNKTFRVNESFDLRENNDKYGRKMTDLRKSFTENDQKPFPINY